MTEDSQKLFDGPWVFFSDPDNSVFLIESNSGEFIAEAMMLRDAKRLACLPELYDALNKQVYYRCVDCLRITAKTIDDIPLNKDMIECGCPRHRTDCGAFDVWQLLKKVRDGE